MKFVLGFVLLVNVAFAGTQQNPQYVDISINDLVNYHCIKSSYFNTNQCLVYVTKCYRNYQWPKTVDVFQKIHVMNECVASIYK
jgi:hypothetical protein